MVEVLHQSRVSVCIDSDPGSFGPSSVGVGEGPESETTSGKIFVAGKLSHLGSTVRASHTFSANRHWSRDPGHPFLSLPSVAERGWSTRMASFDCRRMLPCLWPRTSWAMMGKAGHFGPDEHTLLVRLRSRRDAAGSRLEKTRESPGRQIADHSTTRRHRPHLHRLTPLPSHFFLLVRQNSQLLRVGVLDVDRLEETLPLSGAAA